MKNHSPSAPAKNWGNRLVGAWIVTSLAFAVLVHKVAGVVLLLCLLLVLWKHLMRLIIKLTPGPADQVTFQRGAFAVALGALGLVGVLAL